MRKIFTALTTLLLICSITLLAACGSKASNPYVGSWTATKIAYSGLEMDVDVLGIDILLELTESGNASLSVDGENEDGTWEEAETGISLAFAEETLDCTLEEGVLTVGDPEGEDGAIMFEQGVESESESETAAGSSEAQSETENTESSETESVIQESD